MHTYVDVSREEDDKPRVDKEEEEEERPHLSQLIRFSFLFALFSPYICILLREGTSVGYFFSNQSNSNGACRLGSGQSGQGSSTVAEVKITKFEFCPPKFVLPHSYN